MPVQFDITALQPLRPPRQPSLPPEIEQSLMSEIMRQSGGMIETLGRALDTPGALARGALTGDAASGASWDSDRRVTGEELLDKYGILKPDDNPYFRTGMGLAAEIATDPLSWVSLPMRSLTAAGKAAKAAGILDKASDAALAAKGIQNATKSMTGSRTMNWAKGLVNDGLVASPETFAVRPLIGPRVARATTSLDDLVKYVDNANQNQDAYTAVRNYLANKGMSYNEVATDKLGGAFGLGFFSPNVTFTPPGSLHALDALDAAGQAIGWSYPSRLASSMFDNRVADTIAPADQVEALKHANRIADATAAGRRLAARHAMTVSDIKLNPQAQAMLGAKSLLSEQGNDFLTRMFENVPNASDNALKAAIGPDLDKAIASWDAIRKQNIVLGDLSGMAIQPYGDMHGVLYSPRRAAEADFGEYGAGLSRAQYNTRMLEQAARQDYLKVPGGTVALREVSLLPKVDEFVRNGASSQYSIGEVGKEIADYLNNKYAPQYKVGQDQGQAIASFMQRLDKRRPAGLPVFSEHPISAQARNIVGQHIARANAQHIYESIAEAAINASRSTLPGAHKSVMSAITDIARATGLKVEKGTPDPTVLANLQASIARRMGINPATVDLSKFSIPEKVYDRLTRIQSFYSSPRAQTELMSMFDKFSQLFKGFVLAWPSRFVRDMYSNAFSIFLENGSVNDTLSGLSTARLLLRGQFPDAIQGLRELPGYARLGSAEAVRKQFLEDAAASGILQTLPSSDLLTSNRTGDIAQLVPGSTPMYRSDALRELGGDWSQFFQIKDIKFPWQKQAAYETKNPILNASQKLSDFTDSVARLGGYISLLRQGISPSEAARRMTSALVDYASLTGMERAWFRAIFPWWAYNSRIGKYVVNHLLQNPGGGYAQTIRALNTVQRSDENTYIPASVRQQFAVRIPDALRPYFGVSKDNPHTVVLKDVDVPGVDVLSLMVPGKYGLDVGETLFNVLNQANPLIRGTLELATDKDFFSKRPLSEAETPLDKIYMQATGSPFPMSPYARIPINMIPGLQRPIGLIGGLMDPRLPFSERVPKTVMNALAGVKRQDIPAEWLYSDLKQENAKLLKGYTRTFTTEGVPDRLLPFVPPALLPNAMLGKQLDKKLVLLRKQRMEQQKKTEAAK